MVHWPEVMVTYDSTDKVLFSADGFGKFGALDVSENWADEARRYYIGIVGKYGAQVQSLLKKAAALDIEKICPLHGPVVEDDLAEALELYNTWSSYARGERRRDDRLHLRLRPHRQGRRAAGRKAPSGRLPEGRRARSGPVRHGAGCGRRIPLRKAGAGHHHLQRRCVPLHARPLSSI